MNNGILGNKNNYDSRVYPTINLTADADNLSLPNNYDIIRLTSSSVVAVTGIVGIKDKIFTIFNVGAYDVRFSNLSSFSTTSNKILVSNGSDVILSPNESLVIFYDDSSKLWRTAGVVKSYSPSDYNYANTYTFTLSSAPSAASGSNGVYTWSLPVGAKVVEFICIASGAGGGSGRRGAADTARYGGGGGAAGCAVCVNTSASIVTTPISVVVPAGGGGGAAVTVDNTDGNNGGNGANAIVGFNGLNMIIASAGTRGLGGTATAGTGGSFTSNSGYTFRPSANGGNSSVSADAGSTGVSTGLAGTSGAGGGGISAANTAYNGGTQGNGGPAYLTSQSAFTGVIYTARTGGAASITAAAGAGGNGQAYGFGGNGGGASLNGFNSGAGGNGSDGYVRITVWS